MNMHRITLLSLFLLVSANYSWSQQSLSASEISRFKSKVEQKAANTKTIVSNFTQKKHLDFLENDVISQGKLSYKAPNLVKWMYTKPFKYSVVFKDNKLFINNDGKKSDVKIGASKLFEQLNQLIIKSVNGNMFDAMQFDMAFSKLNMNYTVNFKSKNTDLAKYIAAFVLKFNDKYEVVSVKMVEPTGDYTLIEFNKRQDNIPLSDEIFSN